MIFGPTAELAAVLAGLGVLLASFAVGGMVVRAQTAARLSAFVRLTPTTAPTVRLQREEAKLAIIERMNHRLRRASLTRRRQLQLIRAGINIPAGRFLVLQACGAAFACLAAQFGAATYAQVGRVEALVAAALAAGAGWFLPNFWVSFKEGRRMKRFEGQLAPAIDAMAGALQAGSSLPQAMEMISREMPEPIGEEMSIVVRELAVGVPMQQAFDNLLERIRSLDLDMLLTAIAIQHRVGGNLGSILRSISHTIRERLRIRGEIRVLTAQARISAYVVSALPVLIVVALFFIAPAYIMKLFQPGITRVMLGVAVLGIAAGYYAMRKIADIDV